MEFVSFKDSKKGISRRHPDSLDAPAMRQPCVIAGAVVAESFFQLQWCCVMLGTESFSVAPSCERSAHWFFPNHRFLSAGMYLRGTQIRCRDPPSSLSLSLSRSLISHAAPPLGTTRLPLPDTPDGGGVQEGGPTYTHTHTQTHRGNISQAVRAT